MLTLFALLAFFSCDSLFSKNPNSDDGEIVAFTGTVSLSPQLYEGGAVPEQYVAEFSRLALAAAVVENNGSRLALPTMPTGGTTVVNATASDGTKIDEKTVSGNSFSLVLASGKTWTVTVSMTVGSITLSDSAEFDLTTVGAASHNFVLKPSSSGSGSVSLSFGTLSSINTAQIVSVNSATPSSSWSCTTTQLTCTSIASGVYEIRLRFKNSDSTRGYETRQQIVVYQNMTTNKWVYTGSGPVNSDGVFTITDSILVDVNQTEFYVGATPANSTTNDYYLGTVFKPLATISGALNKISSGPSDAQYIIHVANGIEEEVTSQITIQKNITIECWRDAPGDRKGTATLKWTGTTANATMISISSSGALTIDGVKTGDDENPAWSGLVLDGNKNGADGVADTDDDKTAQGIKVSSGFLRLKGGAIRDFHYSPSSNAYGAGVYCSSNIFMEGGVISNNKCNSGGGIYVSGGKFTMNDGIIMDCNGENGGGVYVTDGNFTMNDGTISGNTATEKGGGIYINGNNLYGVGSATITGGVIMGNSANDSGGGIRVAGSSSSYNGKAYLNMTGGVIKGNSAASNGGAISNASAVIYMSGTAVIGDPSQSAAATDTEHCSNYALNGGGILSSGNYNKLYLGYTPNSEPTGEPIPASNFSGGIFYNYSTNTNSSGVQSNGGGICQYNGETRLYNCKIMNNGAAGKGGGIVIDGGASCLLDSGTIISGNSSASQGNGLYYSASSGLSINGSAYLASTNDIYLSNGNKLTIAGELTPPSEANGKSATITPYSYSGTIVQPANGVTDEVFAAAIGKLSVTPNGSTNYTIGSNGALVAQ